MSAIKKSANNRNRPNTTVIIWICLSYWFEPRLFSRAFNRCDRSPSTYVCSTVNGSPIAVQQVALQSHAGQSTAAGWPHAAIRRVVTSAEKTPSKTCRGWIRLAADADAKRGPTLGDARHLLRMATFTSDLSPTMSQNDTQWHAVIGVCLKWRSVHLYMIIWCGHHLDALPG